MKFSSVKQLIKVNQPDYIKHDEIQNAKVALNMWRITRRMAHGRLQSKYDSVDEQFPNSQFSF